ncbi:hypothetical protein [Xanthomonas arboricola]|uniref:hypothetical protein n=1 Tax=Xanthomonas arboricola TaxID=56448 RepID=UPI0011B06154|nr:hypothetical protein [Xanthomonas arboricola]
MPILDDAHWAEELLDCGDTQFTRRAYVRNVFAMIEGCIWALKETVLLAHTVDGRKKLFARGEYELLSDTSFDLKVNGEIKEQTKYLRLPENVRFTFRILKKYFGGTYNIASDSKSWQAFLAAQNVRNRITHPKTSEEFEVSDAELEQCQLACSWFNNLVLSFFQAVAGTSAEVQEGR